MGTGFGQTREQDWNTKIAGLSFFQLDPKFDGNEWGVQTELDLVGLDHENGARDRFGAFYTHAKANGDTFGFTLGQPHNLSGDLDLEGDSAGAYYTHIGPSDWYVDVVAMHTWLDGDATSKRGLGADLGGDMTLASVEGGYPIPLLGGWMFEPQIQGIWQNIDFDDTSDLFSSIDYEDFDLFTGRLGMRLGGETHIRSTEFKPYLVINLWHNFSGDDATVRFNGRPVTTDLSTTALEVGGGFSTQLTSLVSIYGQVSYSTDVFNGDTGDLNGVGGNAGVRLRW